MRVDGGCKRALDQYHFRSDRSRERYGGIHSRGEYWPGAIGDDHDCQSDVHRQPGSAAAAAVQLLDLSH